MNRIGERVAGKIGGEKTGGVADGFASGIRLRESRSLDV